MFVKQLGSKPYEMRVNDLRFPDIKLAHYFHLNDRKGGDMSEWPDELRMRQFPEVA